ncbi:MAG TPA: hypothetical protein VFE55_18520 [Acidimicrobiia bacterium]|nr:hypothetical protein [Acidimicrobiia bacterium]
MAATLVVATGQQPIDGPALARSLRTLADAGYDPVVVAPPAVGAASGLTLALGTSRAGRRAVPVVAHVLIDPLDPALAHPPEMASPEPLAVLETEAIAALARSGFAVVVADSRPVVPHRLARGSGALSDGDYEPATAALDPAACARRLAGDLGAGVLVFVTGDEGPPWTGDIDVREAEDHLAAAPPHAAELVAAARFLRAGGELAVLTTATGLPGAISSPPTDRGSALRIHRTLARPRSDAPAVAAGWC